MKMELNDKSADSIIGTDNWLAPTELGELIIGMRAAYARGENVLEFARKKCNTRSNVPMATLIAYDLQSGTYVADSRKNKDEYLRWCTQLAAILDPYMNAQTSMLEVGCGEATTLAGVLASLRQLPLHAFGFDISWSRCAHGTNWLFEQSMTAQLFVADLFNIPFADSSIDVVYTSHSLEPNGGREYAAIKELLRVARRAVVLIEPIYELGTKQAQDRMRKYGYVRNLKAIALSLRAKVVDYGLLEFNGNELNPSGLILLEKEPIAEALNVPYEARWRCPLTSSTLAESSAGFFSTETGIVYPVLGGIPLLHVNHAVVASSFQLAVVGSKPFSKSLIR